MPPDAPVGWRPTPTTWGTDDRHAAPPRPAQPPPRRARPRRPAGDPAAPGGGLGERHGLPAVRGLSGGPGARRGRDRRRHGRRAAPTPSSQPGTAATRRSTSSSPCSPRPPGGTLAAPVFYDTAGSYPSRPNSVAIGDVNGDGVADVVVGIDDIGVQVFPGIAGGGLGSPSLTPTPTGAWSASASWTRTAGSTSPRRGGGPTRSPSCPTPAPGSRSAPHTPPTTTAGTTWRSATSPATASTTSWSCPGRASCPTSSCCRSSRRRVRCGAPGERRREPHDAGDRDRRRDRRRSRRHRRVVRWQQPERADRGVPGRGRRARRTRSPE